MLNPSYCKSQWNPILNPSWNPMLHPIEIPVESHLNPIFFIPSEISLK